MAEQNGKVFYGDSQAIDIDVGETGDALIQYNYSHDNGGGFFEVMGGAKTNGITVRYNISINDGHTNCGDGTTINLQIGNVFVYNNTFFNDIGGGIVLPNQRETYFQNNIFYCNSDCVYPANPSYSNNAYFGHAASTNDPHGLRADPQFTKPGAKGDGLDVCAGYALRPGSPCINKGMGIRWNGGRDFFGDPLDDAQLDIGAAEKE